MAIVVSFDVSEVTLSTTGGTSTFTLTDITTGYGTRSNFGVYLSVFKTDYSGAMSPITSSENGTPQTSTIWTGDFDSDGWYQGLYVAVPNWSSGTTYSIYDAVYDLSSDTVYTSVTNSNLNHAVSNPTYWSAVSDPTTLALNVGLSNESGNLDGTTGSAQTINFVLDPLLKKEFGYQAGIAFLEESTDAKRTQDVRKYQLLSLAVNCISESADAGDYQTAEIVARRATNLQ